MPREFTGKPQFESVTPRMPVRDIDAALADEPYGLRDFEVIDPDGNSLLFGQALE